MHTQPFRRPVPIKARPTDLFNLLAQQEVFKLRILTRAVRFTTDLSPNGLILQDEHAINLPDCGLIHDSSRIAGVYSRRNVLELDFNPYDHRLDFAPPAQGLATIEKLFGTDPIDESVLEKERASRCPAFIPCDCCREAATNRRTHAIHHPLTTILATSPDLHITIRSQSFIYSRPHEAKRVTAVSGWILAVSQEDAVIKIDAGFLHAICIGIQKLDGETRATMRTYDMLGKDVVELSSPHLHEVERWRSIFQAAT